VGYIYLKSSQPRKSSSPSPKFKLSVFQRKLIAGGLFSFGLFLFSSAVLPIVQFQLEYATKFGQIVNPLSAKFYNQQGGVLGEVANSDYTQLNSWFVSEANSGIEPGSLLSNSSEMTYRISIPNLKVNDAVVTIGSMDLKKSLIQYPQTALPGQLGNGVIFGHSVLPQFFNPKSYLTIFSTLYRLKTGDEILIDFDNIQYKYLVEEMYEVSPDNLSVLEQRYDGRYLNLITCSPPGTYLRRLVVKARIVDN
jgi:sortase A